MVAHIAMRFLAFVFCFVMAPLYSAKIPDLAAESGHVFDGDTFAARVKLENGAAVSVRVRISNIDTPEISGECEYETELADRARRRLSALLPEGSDVTLSKIKDDKYLGRIDALVKLPSGKDAGAIMIGDGLARAYSGGRRRPWCKGEKNE